jgi:cell wall-associated NlpC family hydrolase
MRRPAIWLSLLAVLAGCTGRLGGVSPDDDASPHDAGPDATSDADLDDQDADDADEDDSTGDADGVDDADVRDADVDDAEPDAEPDAPPCTPVVDTIIADARSHLGQPYVWGAEGPDAYDCSGLVYAVFQETGHFDIIGNGSARTVSDIAAVFAARGDEDTVDLEPGDLVTFGNTDGYGSYTHIGIYVGGYDSGGQFSDAGWVVNALNEDYGVVESELDWLIPGVQTYLHTRLDELPCTPEW